MKLTTKQQQTITKILKASNNLFDDEKYFIG